MLCTPLPFSPALSLVTIHASHDAQKGRFFFTNALKEHLRPWQKRTEVYTPGAAENTAYPRSWNLARVEMPKKTHGSSAPGTSDERIPPRWVSGHFEHNVLGD